MPAPSIGGYSIGSAPLGGYPLGHLPPATNVPTVTVACAFGIPPGTVPSSTDWVDISRFVKRFDCQRGRQYELNQVQAGTANLTLDNLDRRFEPLYAAGAYYPNVVPLTWIRIQATWLSAVYSLFTGYVEAWPQSYPALMNEVQITAVDGFKTLALAALNGAVYAQELTGTRVTNVLNSLNWPASARAIDAGRSTVQGVTLSGTKGLAHLLDVADTEVGVFFIAGNGNATFKDRYGRIAGTASLGTFGDGDGELPYTALDFNYDDTNIWNDVRATRTGGTEQIASDATSKTSYFTRTHSKQVLLVADSDALDWANFFLNQYKQPRFRTQGVTFTPSATLNLWPQMLGRELSDRVTINRRPFPVGTAPISGDFFIEGLSHTVDMGSFNWSTTWRLSPTNPQTSWILDDTTASVLDSTTRLAF